MPLPFVSYFNLFLMSMKFSVERFFRLVRFSIAVSLCLLVLPWNRFVVPINSFLPPPRIFFPRFLSIARILLSVQAHRSTRLLAPPLLRRRVCLMPSNSLGELAQEIVNFSPKYHQYPNSPVSISVAFLFVKGLGSLGGFCFWCQVFVAPSLLPHSPVFLFRFAFPFSIASFRIPAVGC